MLLAVSPLFYVPSVTKTSVKIACNKNVLITSHLFHLSSFSVAVSFLLLEPLQVSGVLGV